MNNEAVKIWRKGAEKQYINNKSIEEKIFKRILN